MVFRLIILRNLSGRFQNFLQRKPMMIMIQVREHVHEMSGAVPKANFPGMKTGKHVGNSQFPLKLMNETTLSPRCGINNCPERQSCVKGKTQSSK